MDHEEIFENDNVSNLQKIRAERGRWALGNSPAGVKPKGVTLKSLIKRELEKVRASDNKSNMQLLAERIVERAIVGDDRKTQEFIWEQLDGRAVQSNINVQAQGGCTAEEMDEILKDIMSK
jgi:hypothetical protein